MDRRKRVKEILKSKEFCNELENVIQIESSIVSDDLARNSIPSSESNTLQRASKLGFYSGDRQSISALKEQHFCNSSVNFHNLGI